MDSAKKYGPWAINKFGTVIDSDGRQVEASGMAMASGYREPGDNSFKTRDELVRRWNAHDALVEALKNLAERIDGYSYDPDIPTGMASDLSRIAEDARKVAKLNEAPQ
jgi:hypothetical protein